MVRGPCPPPSFPVTVSFSAVLGLTCCLASVVLLNVLYLITALLPVCAVWPADIKKRIENLIEREFLERDATDRKMYRYLA